MRLICCIRSKNLGCGLEQALWSSRATKAVIACFVSSGTKCKEAKLATCYCGDQETGRTALIISS
eukprot:4931383-Amphidinium_carterae.1